MRRTEGMALPAWTRAIAVTFAAAIAAMALPGRAATGHVATAAGRGSPWPYVVVSANRSGLRMLTPAGHVYTVPSSAQGQVLGVAVSTGGIAYVADGAGGTLTMLALPNGRLLGRRSIPRATGALSLLEPFQAEQPFGQALFVIAAGYIGVFAARPPFMAVGTLSGRGGTTAAITPDADVLFIAGKDRPGIDVYDTEAGELSNTLLSSHRFSSLAVARSHGGQLWAFGTDSDIEIISTHDGTLVHTMRAPRSASKPAEFTQAVSDPAFPRVWVATLDGTIRSYDTRSFTVGPVLRVSAPGAGRIAGLAVSPDGQRLFVSVAGANRTLEISAASGALLRDFGPGSGGGRLTLVVPAAPPRGSASLAP